MRYVYYGYGKKDKVGWGLLQDDEETIIEGTGDPWRGFVPDKMQTELSDVRLFRPLAPGQILEIDGPTALIKAPARTFGPNDKIMLPRRGRQTIAYGKLGIIIAKNTKQVSVAGAADSILGYTCVLEFTALNPHHSEIGSAFGPTIAIGLNPFDLNIRLLVNAQEVSSTKINVEVAQAISQASQQRTLAPGDIVLCNPGSTINQQFQTATLYPGDVVQLVIEKIGKLNLLCGLGR
jgi:2-keto-4-pentenoate hydratase/2-oxohepta-3-ene-1,7-dioic acid hydratase in catechol pathway